MNDGIGGVNQASVINVFEAELRRGQVSAKKRDARAEVLMEAGKLEVELESAPQADFSLVLVLGADQKVQVVRVSLKQLRDDMGPNVPGRAGQENCHDAPVPVRMVWSVLEPPFI